MYMNSTVLKYSSSLPIKDREWLTLCLRLH